MPGSKLACIDEAAMKKVISTLFLITSVAIVIARGVGWMAFSWLETVGAISGAACVLLVVFRNIWNFPVGIVSCLCYLVFFTQGRLYADAGLQVVFILLSIQGWILWARVPASEKPIRQVPFDEITILAILFPFVWLGLTQLLIHLGGAAPVLDSFVTILSLAAQWLLNRRYIESWLAWIVVDQVSVALFWTREMYLTAGLYSIFLVICIGGLIEWRSILKRSHS